MTERRTLNSRLIGKGYRIEGYVPVNVPEKVSEFLFDIARGYFRHYQIIPTEVALEGSEWQPEHPGHILYTRISNKHPDYKKRKEPSARFTVIELRHRSNGKDSHNLPLEHL